MANVNALGHMLANELAEHSVERWTNAIANFALSPERTKATNTYFKENIRGILEDAVLGRCTIGHSCLPGAQDALADLNQKVSGEDVNYVEMVLIMDYIGNVMLPSRDAQHSVFPNKETGGM